MRYNQGRCYVCRVVAALWILGSIALITGVDQQRPIADTNSRDVVTANPANKTIVEIPANGEQDNVPKVISLENNDELRISPSMPKINPIEVTKQESKDSDTKPTIDGKKKLVTEFKQKSETKYQKIKDDDGKTIDGTKSSASNSEIEKISDYRNFTEILNVPLLLQGEPITVASNATDNNVTQGGEVFTAMPRGRALNISALEPINSLHANITDLSDVSMDDEDKEVDGADDVATRNETSSSVSATSLTVNTKECIEGNKTYAIGDKIVRGCEESCVCAEGGNVENCEPLCRGALFRAGRNKDPYCFEQTIGDDKCCVLLACASSAPPKVNAPDETCTYGNQTLAKGQRVENGCTEICVCGDGGIVKCEPRCPPNETTSASNEHDRCVALTDPRDSCCTMTLCDVTLGDYEIKTENAADLSVNLTNIKVLNSTTILLKLSSDLPNDFAVEISDDNHVWRQQKLDKSGMISNLEPAHSYFVRITEGGRTGPTLQVFLPAEVKKTNITDKVDKSACSHRGKLYKIGAEWYDECISFCVCNEGAKTECATIECPTDSGLDVLNPHCIDWETVPSDFVAKPPQCCPHEVRCRNNGSCLYEGVSYENWSELPTNVTGCEKRCYCEVGKISCQAACPPVTEVPPPNLQCPENQAILAHLPGDDCCSHWVCDQSMTHSTAGLDHQNLPSGFPILGGVPGYPGGGQPHQGQDEVTVKALEALDDGTIRIIFMVPPVFVGLPARVELRYTSDKANLDPSTWKSQIFIPPNDLIATQQLEFELDDLEPLTEYKIRVTVNLLGLANSPSSKIYSVRTLERNEELPTLPPQIPVDAELRLEETNSTWINVIWRKFTEYEMQFIDGVQLRYKEHDSKVYASTPIIHRTVTNYVIENLKPSTNYEIGISIIPFAGQTTELISEKTIQVTTAIEPDPYYFDVKVDIKTIKSTAVEVSWTGVPYPEDKYVNIYRAIYQSDSGKEDTSTFKIAKRDSPAKTMINDLKPGTRYRLWIEVYLTNGRIKKSNVQDFVTKPGVVLPAGVSQQGKLASIPLHEGDYYGPLVIVAIVASLAILSTLVLLMMLMKRRSSSKADISPRKTTAAYDNPSYKTCEDGGAHANGRNKRIDHEMNTISDNADVKESA